VPSNVPLFSTLTEHFVAIAANAPAMAHTGVSRWRELFFIRGVDQLSTRPSTWDEHHARVLAVNLALLHMALVTG